MAAVINKIVFISKDGLGKNATLLIDGKEVKGVKGIKIESSVDDIVELSIDYVTPIMENN